MRIVLAAAAGARAARRGPRPGERATRIVLAAAACAVLCGPAFAGWRPGRAAADKDAVAPLRQADLAAALDGREPPAGWVEALGKLPDRCKKDEALEGSDCNDDARCAWLAARGAALEAVRDRAELRGAADRLRRAAARLAPAACAAKDERWRDDARQAAIDAALVEIQLLRRLPTLDAGPTLDPEDERVVGALLAAAEKGGLASLPANELPAARGALRTALERRSWLIAQPAFARLRGVLPGFWAPLGGVPRECGADLFRADLLEDQWRGRLVREVVPEALDCLRTRLVPELARRGAVADAAGATELAAWLAEKGRRDPGGRYFGIDGETRGKIEKLVEAMKAPEPRQVAAAEPPAPAPRPAKTPAKGGRIAPPPTNVPLRPAPGPAPAPTPQGDPAESSCAALAAATTEDLASARRVASGVDEDACAPGAPRARRAKAADGLERMAAAVRIRGAARLVARGDASLALRELELVAEKRRGPVFYLVAAWAARRDGDEVGAARYLAKIDQATLDRLRRSNDPSVAALVDHATASGGR